MTKKKEDCFKSPPECLLHNKNIQRCSESRCFRCGWNAHEARLREILFAAKGLTMCSDGLRRLVIPARNDVKEETR